MKNIVEKILKFNNQNQRGQGVKIVAPDQMLSRYKEIIQKNLKMK